MTMGEKKSLRKKNLTVALAVVLAYLAVYLLGRLIWCEVSQSSFVGWLLWDKPSGKHSYLYGWLLSRNLFWIAMAISVLPAFFGKRIFSILTLTAFVLGIVFGMIFGPNPEGAAYGQGHYGWAIWGTMYLLSVAVGIFMEKFKRKGR